jgi:gamma-glutamyltranspeptidase/glutathione hydrolase
MPDQIFTEPNALTPEAHDALTQMGYTITQQSGWGAAEGIVIGDKNGHRVLYGANDRRRPAGAAVGY